MSEPELIRVQSATPETGRVALWERAEEHPNGEVWVAGHDIVLVARTPEIEHRLAKGLLVEAQSPVSRALSIPPASTSSDDAGVEVDTANETDETEEAGDDATPAIVAEKPTGKRKPKADEAKGQ